MTANRVRLLWSPRHLAPPNVADYVAALERAIPAAIFTVHLTRDRYGWTITYAAEGEGETSRRPLEYKRAAAWALQRTGLLVRDCPVCGDPLEIIGTEPRNFELRVHGVAPDHTHARYYAHRYATACTPLDLWARFTVPCRCGQKLRFVLAASESLESGGALACECGTRYALEPRVTGGGMTVSADAC
jgi:hypothetical protein